MVSLTNKFKKFYVHRLLAQAFLGGIKPKQEVNHKDGDKTNNSLNNLEVVSSSENKKHAYQVLGKRPWNIKLRKDQADMIRIMYNSGLVSQKALGKFWKVSTMVINRIINNKQLAYKKYE